MPCLTQHEEWKRHGSVVVRQTPIFLFRLQSPASTKVWCSFFSCIKKDITRILLYNWFEWISSVSTICDRDHETNTNHIFCRTIKSNNLWPWKSYDNFFDTYGFDMIHLFAYFNAARLNASKTLLFSSICLCHISLRCLNPIRTTETYRFPYPVFLQRNIIMIQMTVWEINFSVR